MHKKSQPSHRKRLKTAENKGFLTFLNAMGRSVPLKTPIRFQIANKINGFVHVSYGTALKNNEEFFPDFRDCFPMRPVVNGKGETIEKCTFFKHIRCGILHQAETTGGYRILRDKSHLFDEDKNGKSINADKFVKALGHFLNEYFKNLSSDPIDSDIWKNAVKKITHICDNCRT